MPLIECYGWMACKKKFSKKNIKKNSISLYLLMRWNRKGMSDEMRNERKFKVEFVDKEEKEARGRKMSEPLKHNGKMRL